MSLKMQADIELLRAHYDELSTRLAELEAQVKLMNNARSVLAVDAGDKKNVERTRTPQPRNPRFVFPRGRR